jgi:hypothetical protein
VRRTLPLLALVASLGLAVMPSQAIDVGEQFGCSASSGAAVSLIGLEGPSCSFDLLCVSGGPFFPCIYSVRISANGTGLVEAAMSGTVVEPESGTTIEWLTLEGGPADPPSCSGTLTCSSPPDDDAIFLGIRPGPHGFGFVTVRCSAGGLAAVESVSCQANNVEIEEAPR